MCPGNTTCPAAVVRAIGSENDTTPRTPAAAANWNARARNQLSPLNPTWSSRTNRPSSRDSAYGTNPGKVLVTTRSFVGTDSTAEPGSRVRAGVVVLEYEPACGRVIDRGDGPPARVEVVPARKRPVRATAQPPLARTSGRIPGEQLQLHLVTRHHGVSRWPASYASSAVANTAACSGMGCFPSARIE